VVLQFDIEKYQRE